MHTFQNFLNLSLLQSYLTSGLETASLLSSDAQTAFFSRNIFSEVLVPTTLPAHISLPEYYTADHSRPPTPNFAQFELTELQYTIQKTIPVYQFLQNALLQITTFYIRKEKKHNLKDPKFLI